MGKTEYEDSLLGLSSHHALSDFSQMGSSFYGVEGATI